MEEKKQETQLSEKGRTDKKRMTDIAGHVVVGGGIGAVSYAYGAHRISENDTDDVVSYEKDTVEQTVQEEEQVQDVDIQADENKGTFAEEVVVEPEPIVHTDEIDFVLQEEEIPAENDVATTVVDSTNEVSSVDLPEPVYVDSSELEGEILIDPAYPEDELFAEESNGINVNDMVINDIGSDIQQDLMG